MSLHDEIMAIQPTGHQTRLSDACKSGHKEALQAAANLAIKADAEIARLQSQFDPSKFAHRQDCCGSQIDTHCLGCTMAERDRYDAEIDRLRSTIEDCNPYLKDGEVPADRIRRDIRDNDALMSLLAAEKKIRERITGENAVLRDLLRDAMDVMRAFCQHGGDWIASKILEDRITAALSSDCTKKRTGKTTAASG